LQKLKKQGPTIKELQEEFGGAGNFTVPVEEHYMLDEEDWRYDKWPEFMNGKNVADFYDKDIEKKLLALEKEEDELLKMEADEKSMMVDESDEEGIT
jgi:nucleolar GTP-binding protein